MTIIRRIIQKLNDDVVQKWKKELIEVQNLRCNNKLFAVRGEMYSLFGYTVMNKLMIMKSYWLGKMFSNLKILDFQFEVLSFNNQYKVMIKGAGNISGLHRKRDRQN